MMWFKYIKLTNYIGIANGTGLHTIEIDFTKCKNRFIIIKGDNGSGKSTLFTALQVLPDPSSMFIPGLDACKIIEVVDGDTGCTYSIRYDHQYKKESYSTKGYVIKIFSDGTKVNMNDHGNITAAKDIIFSEMNLDANFISLSQLSEADKGLASKTPAERKRFVASILSSLDIYNSIHKTISKRASTYKSMMNATTSKIDKLGDETLLRNSLSSLVNRINAILVSKEDTLQILGSQKGIINQLDPTGSIRKMYADTISDLNILRSSKTSLENKISYIKSSIDGDYTLEDISRLKLTTEVEISSLESSINSLLADNETESRDLQLKISRLNALQSETNYITVQKMLRENKEKISEYEEYFHKMGIDKITLSKDEYVIGLNILKDIKDTVDIFKDRIDYSIMQISLSEYIPIGSYPDKDTLVDEIQQLTLYLNECKQKLVYYNGILDVAGKLDMRPSQCSIDTCNFIKDAVEAMKQDPVGNIKELQAEIFATEQILTSKEKDLEVVESIIECINYFKVLFRNIDGYSSILKRLPNGDIFSDKDKFVQKLLSGSTFEEINDIYPYITKASMIEDYNNIVRSIEKLEADVKIYESKNHIILEIQDSINTLTDKVNALQRDILNNRELCERKKIELAKYTSTEISLKSLSEHLSSLQAIETDILEKTKNLESMENSIATIQNAKLQIDTISRQLAQINQELNGLENDRNNIEHSLRLIEEYKSEMAEYGAKYEKIEAIKYYASYNTGIQTIYMSLYMNKVNQIANQLMQYTLGGRFQLQRWIIDENQFKIPCLGSGGYLNDDISSLSGGEAAIVSSIISLSLLYQASTKFNIPKFDEVDATLDSTNRLQFIMTIDHLLDILKSKQSILISHNNELNLANADIIMMRIDDQVQYNDIRNSGNVIFDVREYASTTL